MVKNVTYDFSGYATKNDLKCTDGRVIRKDAFKDNDGDKVPLVWQHLHNEPANILGHAILENRDDGVYAYCTFNDSDSGKNAKLLVAHGDIKSMSIFANDLIQKRMEVMHGNIREVSLVLTGANPGAVIDNLTISHDDGSTESFDDEAIIYTDEVISLSKTIVKEDNLKHADDGGETISDVLNTLSEKQKNVLYFLIGEATNSDDSIGQSDDNQNKLMHKGDNGLMKKNVFDKSDGPKKKERVEISAEDWTNILNDGMKHGSLRKAFMEHAEELVHAGTYGIDNISVLFPDAKAAQATPELYSRDMAWVSDVLGKTRHSPFSRIKTSYADITPDNARARGYVTGAEKHDEVFGLLSRSTSPTTIYKKQKLDRDDIVDITDIDVVSFLKLEMRMMLNEELARAVLVGDGRPLVSEDKISETCIRPIWTDADMYAHHVQIEAGDNTAAIINHITRARQFYKGSGSPVMFVDPTILTDMLLMEDINGYRMYKTEAELAATLRVSRIVEVPIMSGLTRVIAGPVTLNLIAIIVDPIDYTIGADRGGEVNLFDDFDIDFNQYKYLLETRCSGALTKLKSALVIEQVDAG